MTCLEDVLEACSARPTRDYWMGFCPCHEDSVRSLKIWQYEGKLYIRCMAGCDWREVRRKLGLDNGYTSDERRESRIVKKYDYIDIHGEYCFSVLRFEPKRFSPMRYVNEKKTYGLKAGKYVLKNGVYLPARGSSDDDGLPVEELPAARPCLYHEHLLADTSITAPIVFVEGEKDADTVTDSGEAIGVALQGGSSAEWNEHFSDVLRGRHVIIVPDCDAPGRKMAASVLYHLAGVAREITLIDLDPNRQDGYDISDFGDVRAILDAAVGASPSTMVAAVRHGLGFTLEISADDDVPF